MPRKIFAVTNVKIGNGPGEFVNAGDEVDPKVFGKATLLELHEAGAIEVRVVEDEPVAEESDVEPSEEDAEEDNDKGGSEE